MEEKKTETIEKGRIFSMKKVHDARKEEELRASLYQQIGGHFQFIYCLTRRSIAAGELEG